MQKSSKPLVSFLFADELLTVCRQLADVVHDGHGSKRTTGNPEGKPLRARRPEVGLEEITTHRLQARL
jgi:hypothetical protein